MFTDFFVMKILKFVQVTLHLLLDKYYLYINCNINSIIWQIVWPTDLWQNFICFYQKFSYGCLVLSQTMASSSLQKKNNKNLLTYFFFFNKKKELKNISISESLMHVLRKKVIKHKLMIPKLFLSEILLKKLKRSFFQHACYNIVYLQHF